VNKLRHKYCRAFCWLFIYYGCNIIRFLIPSFIVRNKNTSQNFDICFLFFSVFSSLPPNVFHNILGFGWLCHGQLHTLQLKDQPIRLLHHAQYVSNNRQPTENLIHNFFQNKYIRKLFISWDIFIKTLKEEQEFS